MTLVPGNDHFQANVNISHAEVSKLFAEDRVNQEILTVACISMNGFFLGRVFQPGLVLLWSTIPNTVPNCLLSRLANDHHRVHCHLLSSVRQSFDPDLSSHLWHPGFPQCSLCLCHRTFANSEPLLRHIDHKHRRHGRHGHDNTTVSHEPE